MRGRARYRRVQPFYSGAIDEHQYARQIADTDEVGAVFDERDESLLFRLGPPAIGDIADDFGRPNHCAFGVFDGRDRQRYRRCCPSDR